ncbi:MAG: hypothetical protein HQL29_04205, partial [Candidatus Omnitrophica bacterium]|nr:hypothetical protein [Candidatus Omnitrophota bacterium]
VNAVFSDGIYQFDITSANTNILYHRNVDDISYDKNDRVLSSTTTTNTFDKKFVSKQNVYGSEYDIYGNIIAQMTDHYTETGTEPYKRTGSEYTYDDILKIDGVNTNALVAARRGTAATTTTTEFLIPETSEQSGISTDEELPVISERITTNHNINQYGNILYQTVTTNAYDETNVLVNTKKSEIWNTGYNNKGECASQTIDNYAADTSGALQLTYRQKITNLSHDKYHNVISKRVEKHFIIDESDDPEITNIISTYDERGNVLITTSSLYYKNIDSEGYVFDSMTATTMTYDDESRATTSDITKYNQSVAETLLRSNINNDVKNTDSLIAVNRTITNTTDWDKFGNAHVQNEIKYGYDTETGILVWSNYSETENTYDHRGFIILSSITEYDENDVFSKSTITRMSNIDEYGNAISQRIETYNNTNEDANLDNVEENWQLLSVTNKTNTYDKGRLTGYNSETVQESSPLANTITVYEVTEFDSRYRVAESTTTVTKTGELPQDADGFVEKMDETSTVIKTVTSFDIAGRDASYEETISGVSGEIIRSVTDISYYADGKERSYAETSTNNTDGTETMTMRSKIKYDYLGQVISDISDTRRYDPARVGMDDYYVTTHLERTNIAYYDTGLMKDYDSKVWTNAEEDIVTDTFTRNIAYNNLGRQISSDTQTEQRNIVLESTDAIKEKIIGFDDLSDEVKIEFLRNLGIELGLQEADITIDVQDITEESLGNWLDNTRTFLLNTAQNALAIFLNAADALVTKYQQLTQTLLIDVLTGAIDLASNNYAGATLFSLSKAASLAGLNIDVFTSADFFDLASRMLGSDTSTRTPAVVTLAGANGRIRYGTITGITDNLVTYTDMGIEITETIQEFSMRYAGNGFTVTNISPGGGVSYTTLDANYQLPSIDNDGYLNPGLDGLLKQDISLVAGESIGFSYSVNDLGTSNLQLLIFNETTAELYKYDLDPQETSFLIPEEVSDGELSLLFSYSDTQPLQTGEFTYKVGDVLIMDEVGTFSSSNLETTVPTSGTLVMNGNTVVLNDAREGVGPILQQTVEIAPGGGTLSFNCERDGAYNYMSVYVDGVRMIYCGWGKYTAGLYDFPLEPGEHTIVWRSDGGLWYNMYGEGTLTISNLEITNVTSNSRELDITPEEQPASPGFSSNAAKLVTSTVPVEMQIDPFVTVVTTTIKSDVKYSDDGKAITWKEHTTSDLAFSDKVTDTEVTVTYNNEGQMVTYYSKVTENTGVADDSVRTYEFFKEIKDWDELTGAATEWTQKTFNDTASPDLIAASDITMEYDRLGRAKTYEESGTRKNADSTSFRLNESYTLNKTDFLYDNSGKAISWTENTTTSASPNKLSTKLITMAYDAYGRMEKEMEVIHETVSTDDGQILDKWYTVETKNIEYDLYGRILQNKRTTIDAFGKTTVEEDQSNRTYHSSGQLRTSSIKYTENNAPNAPAYTNFHTVNTLIENDGYNNLGQITVMTRTTMSGIKTTVESDLALRTYDLAGRIESSFVEYHETAQETSDLPGLNLKYKVRSDMSFSDSYDSLGRISKMEKTTTSQIMNEETNEWFDTRILVETDTAPRTYDSQNRILNSNINFNETWESADGSDDLSKSYNVATTIISYNNNSMISQMDRITIEDAKVTYESDILDRNYNADGKLTYSQIIYRETGGILDRSYTVTSDMTDPDSYNDYGQIEFMTRTTVENHTTVEGSRFNSTTHYGKTTVENDMSARTYDKYGRLLTSSIEFHEKAQSRHNRTGVTTTTLDNKYMINTRIDSFDSLGRATDIYKTTDYMMEINGVWQTVKTVTEDDISLRTFNEDGNLKTSNVRITENGGYTPAESDAAIPYETSYDVFTNILDYNGLGQIINMTKETTDGNKLTTETDLSLRTYDSQGWLAQSNIRLTETDIPVNENDELKLDRTYNVVTDISSYTALGQVSMMTKIVTDGAMITTEEDNTIRIYDRYNRLLSTDIMTTQSSVYGNFNVDENNLVREEILDTGAVVYHVYAGENLQEYINKAHSGDTVYLHEGIYNGSIQLSSGVNIIGEDNTKVVLTLTNKSDCVKAMGNNLIQGITIDGSSLNGQSGVFVYGENVTIRKNIIESCFYGIRTSNANILNTIIELNVLRWNTIGVYGTGTSTIIQSNTFLNNRDGIYITNRLHTPKVFNNIFSQNTRYDIYTSGIGSTPDLNTAPSEPTIDELDAQHNDIARYDFVGIEHFVKSMSLTQYEYYDCGLIRGIDKTTAKGTKITHEVDTDRQYNIDGDLAYTNISYTETSLDNTLDNNILDREYVIETTYKDYNDLGQIAYMERTTTEDAKITYESDAAIRVYDMNGRLSSSNIDFTEKDSTEIRLNHTYNVLTEIAETDYNDLSQILRMKRTITDGDKKTVEQDSDDNRLYDIQGRLVYSNTNYSEFDMADTSADTSSPYREYNVTTDITSYDGLDRMLRSSRTTTENDLRSTETDIEDRTYYENGSLKSYYVENTREDIIGSTGLNVIVNTRREIAGYNDLGQMTYYTDETINISASKDLITTTVYTGTDENNLPFIIYDINGRMDSYKEISTSENILDPAVYSLEVTTLREYTKYNGLGQVGSFKDTIKSDATPNITNTRTMSSMEYEDGQLYSYSEINTTSDSDTSKITDKKVTTTRTETTYDMLGQVIGYIENSGAEFVNKDSEEVVSPQLIQTDTIVTGITYRSNGLMSGMTEDTHSIPLVVADAQYYNERSISVKSDMDYNDLGQLVTQTQKTTVFYTLQSEVNILGSDADRVTTTTNTLDTKYNDKGQMLYSKTASFQPEIASSLTNVREMSGIVYSASGEMIEYSETTTQGQYVIQGDPSSGLVLFADDSNYRSGTNGHTLVRTLDSSSRIITREYDGNDNLLNIDYPNGEKQTWTYDSLGRIATFKDIDGSKSTYKYFSDTNFIQSEEVVYADGTKTEREHIYKNRNVLVNPAENVFTAHTSIEKVHEEVFELSGNIINDGVMDPSMELDALGILREVDSEDLWLGENNFEINFTMTYSNNINSPFEYILEKFAGGYNHYWFVRLIQGNEGAFLLFGHTTPAGISSTTSSAFVLEKDVEYDVSIIIDRDSEEIVYKAVYAEDGIEHELISKSPLKLYGSASIAGTDLTVGSCKYRNYLYKGDLSDVRISMDDRLYEYEYSGDNITSRTNLKTGVVWEYEYDEERSVLKSIVESMDFVPDAENITKSGQWYISNTSFKTPNFKAPNADGDLTFDMTSDGTSYYILELDGQNYPANMAAYETATGNDYKFDLEISVDGVKFGNIALDDLRNTSSINLEGLSEGEHEIKIRWTNGLYSAGVYDTNLQLNTVKVTSEPKTIFTLDEPVVNNPQDISFIQMADGRYAALYEVDGQMAVQIFNQWGEKDGDPVFLEISQIVDGDNGANYTFGMFDLDGRDVEVHVLSGDPPVDIIMKENYYNDYTIGANGTIIFEDPITGDMVLYVSESIIADDASVYVSSLDLSGNYNIFVDGQKIETATSPGDYYLDVATGDITFTAIPNNFEPGSSLIMIIDDVLAVQEIIMGATTTPVMVADPEMNLSASGVEYEIFFHDGVSEKKLILGTDYFYDVSADPQIKPILRFKDNLISDKDNQTIRIQVNTILGDNDPSNTGITFSLAMGATDISSMDTIVYVKETIDGGQYDGTDLKTTYTLTPDQSERLQHVYNAQGIELEFNKTDTSFTVAGNLSNSDLTIYLERTPAVLRDCGVTRSAGDTGTYDISFYSHEIDKATGIEFESLCGVESGSNIIIEMSDGFNVSDTTNNSMIYTSTISNLENYNYRIYADPDNVNTLLQKTILNDYDLDRSTGNILFNRAIPTNDSIKLSLGLPEGVQLNVTQDPIDQNILKIKWDEGDNKYEADYDMGTSQLINIGTRESDLPTQNNTVLLNDGTYIETYTKEMSEGVYVTGYTRYYEIDDNHKERVILEEGVIGDVYTSGNPAPIVISNSAGGFSVIGWNMLDDELYCQQTIPGLNITTTTTRDQIVYDPDHWRMTSYRDNITSSAWPDSKKTTIHNTFGFDDYGREISYTDTTTEEILTNNIWIPMDLQNERTMSVVYLDNGLIASYTEIAVDSAISDATSGMEPKLKVTTTTHRQVEGYNGSKMFGYTDTITTTAKDVETVRTVSDILYETHLGNMASFNETISENGTGEILDFGHNKYSATVRTDIAYDNNNMMSGYKDVTYSSVAPHKISITNLNDMRYDRNGRMAGQITTTREKAFTETFNPSSDTFTDLANIQNSDISIETKTYNLGASDTVIRENRPAAGASFTYDLTSTESVDTPCVISINNGEMTIPSTVGQDGLVRFDLDKALVQDDAITISYDSGLQVGVDLIYLDASRAEYNFNTNLSFDSIGVWEVYVNGEFSALATVDQTNGKIIFSNSDVPESSDNVSVKIYGPQNVFNYGGGSIAGKDYTVFINGAPAAFGDYSVNESTGRITFVSDEVNKNDEKGGSENTVDFVQIKIHEAVLDTTTTTVQYGIKYNLLGQMISYINTYESTASPSKMTMLTMTDITYTADGFIDTFTDNTREKVKTTLDMTGDGELTIADIDALKEYLVENAIVYSNTNMYDMNFDGVVTKADVQVYIDLLKPFFGDGETGYDVDGNGYIDDMDKLTFTQILLKIVSEKASLGKGSPGYDAAYDMNDSSSLNYEDIELAEYLTATLLSELDAIKSDLDNLAVPVSLSWKYRQGGYNTNGDSYITFEDVEAFFALNNGEMQAIYKLEQLLGGASPAAAKYITNMIPLTCYSAETDEEIRNPILGYLADILNSAIIEMFNEYNMSIATIGNDDEETVIFDKFSLNNLQGDYKVYFEDNGGKHYLKGNDYRVDSLSGEFTFYDINNNDTEKNNSVDMSYAGKEIFIELDPQTYDYFITDDDILTWDANKNGMLDTEDVRKLSLVWENSSGGSMLSPIAHGSNGQNAVYAMVLLNLLEENDPDIHAVQGIIQTPHYMKTGINGENTITTIFDGDDLIGSFEKYRNFVDTKKSDWLNVYDINDDGKVKADDLTAGFIGTFTERIIDNGDAADSYEYIYDPEYDEPLEEGQYIIQKNDGSGNYVDIDVPFSINASGVFTINSVASGEDYIIKIYSVTEYLTKEIEKSGDQNYLEIGDYEYGNEYDRDGDGFITMADIEAIGQLSNNIYAGDSAAIDISSQASNHWYFINDVFYRDNLGIAAYDISDDGVIFSDSFGTNNRPEYNMEIPNYKLIKDTGLGTTTITFPDILSENISLAFMGIGSAANVYDITGIDLSGKYLKVYVGRQLVGTIAVDGTITDFDESDGFSVSAISFNVNGNISIKFNEDFAGSVHIEADMVKDSNDPTSFVFDRDISGIANVEVWKNSLGIDSPQSETYQIYFIDDADTIRLSGGALATLSQRLTNYIYLSDVDLEDAAFDGLSNLTVDDLNAWDGGAGSNILDQHDVDMLYYNGNADEAAALALYLKDDAGTNPLIREGIILDDYTSRSMQLDGSKFAEINYSGLAVTDATTKTNLLTSLDDSNEITIDTWVNFLSLSDEGEGIYTIFSETATGQAVDDLTLINLYYDEKEKKIVFQYHGETLEMVLSDTNVFSNYDWSQITASSDGSNLSIFVNGSLLCATSNTFEYNIAALSLDSALTDRIFCIGSDNGINNFKGNIDEVAIYSDDADAVNLFARKDDKRILSGDSSGTLIKYYDISGEKTSETSLLAYYSFDGSKDQFTDLTKNGNDTNDKESGFISGGIININEDTGVKSAGLFSGSTDIFKDIYKSEIWMFQEMGDRNGILDVSGANIFDIAPAYKLLVNSGVPMIRQYLPVAGKTNPVVNPDWYLYEYLDLNSDGIVSSADSKFIDQIKSVISNYSTVSIFESDENYDYYTRLDMNHDGILSVKEDEAAFYTKLAKCDFNIDLFSSDIISQEDVNQLKKILYTHGQVTKTSPDFESMFDANGDGKINVADVNYLSELEETVFNYDVTRTRINTDYDKYGRESNYQETIISSQSEGIQTVKTTENLVYLANGKTYSYAENAKTTPIIDDGTLSTNIESDITRISTTYNNFGQMAQYVDESKSNVNPGMITRVTFDVIDYDQNGKINEYEIANKDTVSKALDMFHSSITISSEDLFDADAESFTIGGWYKVDLTSDVVLISHDADIPSEGWSLEWDSAINKLTLADNSFDVAVSNDGWFYLVLSYDGSDINIKTWDGINTVNTDTAVVNLDFTSGDISIGSNSFYGTVDDIVIYDRVLETEEITTGASDKKNTPADGLKAMYTFDRGTLTDNSGNQVEIIAPDETSFAFTDLLQVDPSVVTPVLTPPALVNESEVYRTDITFDDRGNIFGYTEYISNPSSPFMVTEKIQSGIRYDKQGNTLNYTEQITRSSVMTMVDSLSIESVLELDPEQYFFTAGVKTGNDFDITFTVTVDDDDDEATSPIIKKIILKAENDVTQFDNVSDRHYMVDGDIIYDLGVNICDDMWHSISINGSEAGIDGIKWLLAEYGYTLASIDEIQITGTDLAIKDMIFAEDRTLAGRKVYDLDKDTWGIVDSSDSGANPHIDALQSNTLSSTNTIERDDIIYDVISGRITSYMDTTNPDFVDKSSLTPDLSVERTMENITYDEHDNILGYDESIREIENTLTISSPEGFSSTIYSLDPSVYDSDVSLYGQNYGPAELNRQWLFFDAKATDEFSFTVATVLDKPIMDNTALGAITFKSGDGVNTSSGNSITIYLGEIAEDGAWHNFQFDLNALTERYTGYSHKSIRHY